jgi:type IV secretory pathway TrbF-like protein
VSRSATTRRRYSNTRRVTSEQWRWIAFGVLLLVAVVAAGIYWLVRRKKTPT